MWDNAALLRSIANALFALSGLAILYGAIYYTVHLPNLFPLRDVRLSSAPEKVVAEQVLQVVRHEVRGNFFTVDIDRVRRSVESLPWVRNVSIRREFPNRLVMELEEHQALAHWNSGALVNQQGEVFAASVADALPSFSGNEDTSFEVTQRYAEFNQALATIDLTVTEIALSARHAWHLKLSNGTILELGRDNIDQRLARFVGVYPYSLAKMQSGVRYVDLRYGNGFAVSVKS
ncbi:MAG: cell division protein FtsQ/DivIB [Gallionella sp.]|nr:FtsQ-type POTRA domain-containing protein [Gallionella sp.]